jgi:hypothetical protein
MNINLTDRAALVGLAAFIVFVVLTIQNPAILSWLLAALYTGPR